MKELCKLKIDGYEERRTVAGILSENGYPVKTEEKKVTYNTTYWLVIYEKAEGKER